MELLFALPERHRLELALKTIEDDSRIDFKTLLSGRYHALPQIEIAALGAADALEQASSASERSAGVAHVVRNASGSRSQANSLFFDLSGGSQ